MFVFLCIITGPRLKSPQPLSYWSNGSVDLETQAFRKLLLTVGDLTVGWNRERSMVKLQSPSVQERDWVKQKQRKQADTVGAQILSKVGVLLCVVLNVGFRGCSLLRRPSRAALSCARAASLTCKA
jgi:hypothetical protein